MNDTDSLPPISDKPFRSNRPTIPYSNSDLAQPLAEKRNTMDGSEDQIMSQLKPFIGENCHKHEEVFKFLRRALIGKNQVTNKPEKKIPEKDKKKRDNSP